MSIRREVVDPRSNMAKAISSSALLVGITYITVGEAFPRPSHS